MKKYKIGNRIITTDSAVKAVKIAKMLGFHNTRVKSIDSEIDELTQEEQRAVEDYREAIKNTSNPKLLEIYSHILQEETEHLKELAQAKEVEDSKTKDWAPDYAIWVKKDGKWLIFGGTNSTNIDKRRFLNSGYEDVTVVENGKKPTNDSTKDGPASPDTELDRVHINYDGYDEPTRGKHYFEFDNKSDAEKAKSHLLSVGYNPGNVITKRSGSDTYYVLQFRE